MRATDLKTKLKLAPDQEAAWTSYLDAMKPAAGMKGHSDHAAMEQLSTPERIDKMRELHQQRDAEMEKRGVATKAFYATLSAEQKKVFDANTMRAPHAQGQKAPAAEGHKY